MGEFNEFNDRPLVAGSIVGLRAFDVDNLGRLRAPHYNRAVFTPGENVAECLRPGAPGRLHQIGGIGCECGFYAYTDGRNDYAGVVGRVSAIIEGYGTCTVGSRGFRAEKARLLALVVPPPRPSGCPQPPTCSCRPRDDAWTHTYYSEVPVYRTVRAAIEAHPFNASGVAS